MSDKKILGAFLLNLIFSIIEFIGGLFTNSVAIISDSFHDMMDALSIGISYILEKISKKKPNNKYSFGYVRYSVLGSLITTLILIIGSILVIINSIKRIINPVDINYVGMLFFAILGFIINFIAVLITKEGKSLNQKTISLHMFEDCLGWLLILIGSILMNFTDIKIIDPILSILVSIFILINALGNLKTILEIFLIKVPTSINIDDIKNKLLEEKEVINVHHIHIWTIDGYNNFAILHIVLNKITSNNKNKVRKIVEEFGIKHITIEFEDKNDTCSQIDCNLSSGHKHVHTHVHKH